MIKLMVLEDLGWLVSYLVMFLAVLYNVINWNLEYVVEAVMVLIMLYKVRSLIQKIELYEALCGLANLDFENKQDAIDSYVFILNSLENNIEALKKIQKGSKSFNTLKISLEHMTEEMRKILENEEDPELIRKAAKISERIKKIEKSLID